MDALVALLGALVVVWIATDVFQSIIVPRPVSLSFRPSGFMARHGWRLFAALAEHERDVDRRESRLAMFAPALLVALLLSWVGALVLAFGAIFFALRHALRPEPSGYWSAVYYAGTSLLTLGYGDFVGTSGLARAISLVAAALGLGTFAVVIAFLFSLFAAFQRREAFIVTLRERTGAPASGVEFLLSHARLDMTDAIAGTFSQAEQWIAEMLETHLAYPILVYFRSTHDEQSWVGTLGALLDASSLLLTTVEASRGPAAMLNGLARHLVSDFSRYFDLPGSSQPGIERQEFSIAYAQLAAAGLPLRPEQCAWEEFGSLRSSYAGPLNAMARYFRIPPTRWIGDRSLIPSAHGTLKPGFSLNPSGGGDGPPRSA